MASGVVCSACLLVCMIQSLLLTSEAKVEVERWIVRSDIRYRFATTQINSTVVNSDIADDREATFQVILPDDAFISNFTMEIDGKVSVGEVKKKEEAKAQYEDAKSRGQSAGLFQARPRHTNKFDYSVNVHPGQKVTFFLTYQEVLKRKFDLYNHVVHIDPSRKVGDMSVEVFIQESRDISILNTPDLRNDLLTNTDISAKNELAVVKRPSSKTAYIQYRPSAGNQGNQPNRFVVQYDVKRDSSAGEVLAVDGYFIHFFAPANLPPIPKDIIFILDVSGSMLGRKIQQLKTAMRKILEEMHSNDYFNIVTFSTDVRFWWKERLIPANNDYKEQARRLVDATMAGGLTNIDKALSDGARFLLQHRHPGHIPVIFFLTDGLPSTGIRDAHTIAQRVMEINDGTSAIFGLAFGSNADYELLKKVTSQNAGVARKIYEASDAALQVSGFYDEISTVTLRDIRVTYLNGSVQEDTLTQTVFKNFFNGTEVVIAGQLSNFSDGVDHLIGVFIDAVGAEGKVNLVLESNSIDEIMVPELPTNPMFTMPRDFAAIAEKSWAFLTIKHLIKEELRADDEQLKKDLNEKILKLSLKYNFVTPLTSMVVTQDNKNNTRVSDFQTEDDGPQSVTPVPPTRRKFMPIMHSLAGRHGSNRRMKLPRPMRHYSQHSLGIPKKRVNMQRQHYPSAPDFLAFPDGPGFHYPIRSKFAGPQDSSRIYDSTIYLPTFSMNFMTTTPPRTTWPPTSAGLKQDNKNKRKMNKKGRKGKRKNKKGRRKTRKCVPGKHSHLEKVTFNQNQQGMTLCKVNLVGQMGRSIRLYGGKTGAQVVATFSKGNKRRNSVATLLLAIDKQTIIRIKLDGANFSIPSKPLPPEVRLANTNTSVVLETPAYSVTISRSVQKWRRKCWFTYAVNVETKNIGTGRSPRKGVSMFPGLCSSNPVVNVNKKQLRPFRVRHSSWPVNFEVIF